MDPVTIAMLLQAAAGTSQLAGGAFSLFDNERPERDIPDSLRQSMALAKIRFSDPYMAGYSEAKEGIDLATANALSAAQEGGAIQESAAGIAGQQNTAMRELAAANEADQDRDFDELQRMLQVMSQQEDMQFQMNEFAPFADRAQEGRDMVGAGFENIYGALDDFGLYSMSGRYGNQSIPSAPSTAYDAASTVARGASSTAYDTASTVAGGALSVPGGASSVRDEAWLNSLLQILNAF